MKKFGEPGSARCGNFVNYYSFNPPDRRIKLIPKTFLSDYFGSTERDTLIALDVGCNSGELTLALYEHLMKADDDRRPCSHLLILGVDIDATLIQRSTACNRHAENIFYRMADIQSDHCRREVVGEFLRNHCAEKFSLVVVNSVTMWIHLNFGDDGLRDFLRYISSIAEYILIEPQDWRSYQSAVRRMKKLACAPFEHFPVLEWRENVSKQILDYLQSEACGLKFVKDFGRTESWNRSLCLFTSP